MPHPSIFLACLSAVSYTHLEIDATCDKISIIKEGRLISSFVADELRHNEKKTYKLHFHTKEDFINFMEAAKGEMCIRDRSIYKASIMPFKNFRNYQKLIYFYLFTKKIFQKTKECPNLQTLFQLSLIHI